MTRKPASLTAATARFVGIYILFMAAIVAFEIALDYFFHYTLKTNISGLIVPFFAALDTGAWIVKRTGEKPEPTFAWRAALSFTLATVILSVTIIFGLYTSKLLPELDGIIADRSGVYILLGVAAALSLLLILLLLLGFGLGVRQTLKLREKAARG